MNTLIDTCAGTPVFQASSVKHIGADIKKLSGGSVFVVCDSNTAKHCYPLVAKHIPAHTLITIAAGEKHKTLQTAEKIWNTLLKHHADRNTLLVAIGGGVVCDITGFAASVYKRGIRVVYLPTTILAQADAAIGGKTGVDFNTIKNTIGTFYQPEAVFMYAPFIKTLSDAHINNGIAEIIKAGIVIEPSLFDDVLEKSKISSAILQKAIQVKCSIVNEDVADNGIRKVLNFGHTIGHAIESVYLTQKKSLLHGEAVALGMIGEAYISHIKVGLPIEDMDDILYVINKWKLVRKVPVMKHVNAIIDKCKQDKKNKGSSIQCILIEEIGVPLIDIPVTDKELKQACVYIENYVNSI